MQSSSPLTKFGPLGAIAVVQLLVILVVPSVGRTDNAGSLGSNPGAIQPPTGSVAGALPGPTAAAGRTAAAGAGGAGAAGPAGVANPVTAAVAAGLTRAQASDTRHCVGGRQFDPAIDYFAPPCLPGVPGVAYADSAGATWQGVSAKTIEIVHYVPAGNAELDSINKVQGLNYDKPQAEILNKGYESFINEKFQLYGRKVRIDTFQGTCSTVPPDLQCLIPEMDKMVAQYHPYAIVFSTTVCSACFAELNRLKVVTTGGYGFSDAFHNANAPYSYDPSMSSTRVELQFADWWCHQMTSQKGSGRKAVFAGKANPAQDFTNQARVLGVIAANDPDNEKTVKEVLYPALKKGCGEEVTHDYFFAQDVNTAAQQTQAAMARMNTTSNPATSMVCLCDPSAPQFFYNAAQNNNYWPEALFAANETMDFDSNAQGYEDSNGASTLACPRPTQGCTYDGAIGLGSADPQLAPEQQAGYKVYKIGSRNAALPSGVGPPILDILWVNYNLVASLISNAGPVLTPARMQAAAPSMGSRGGGTSGHALRRFSPGNWCWTQDVRVAYFNKHKASPYNGKPGAYVSIESRRFDLGQFPTLRQPPAPPVSGRT
jgi:hypothetical protein